MLTPDIQIGANSKEKNIDEDKDKGEIKKLRSKDVQINIGTSSMKVSLYNNLYIEGDFPETIKAEDSLWTIEDSSSSSSSPCCCIVITFEKVVKTWWESVLRGDEMIDTNEVDSSRNISDYDEETQGQIRKIMFDQRQKEMGLATSEEIQLQEMLAKTKTRP